MGFYQWYGWLQTYHLRTYQGWPCTVFVGSLMLIVGFSALVLFVFTV